MGSESDPDELSAVENRHARSPGMMKSDVPSDTVLARTERRRLKVRDGDTSCVVQRGTFELWMRVSEGVKVDEKVAQTIFWPKSYQRCISDDSAHLSASICVSRSCIQRKRAIARERRGGESVYFDSDRRLFSARRDLFT